MESQQLKLKTLTLFYTLIMDPYLIPYLSGYGVISLRKLHWDRWVLVLMIQAKHNGVKLLIPSVLKVILNKLQLL